MSSRQFEPKLVTVLREGYSRALFAQDLGAGLVVGVVALPLAIAFAIASGVRPEQGLFTAIIGGFLISALSGSRVQIGGPTGAFVVLIYATVERFGYQGLAVATLMAGVFLIVLGLARFGLVIRYVPYPVTVGFTSGIALLIASGQLRDALGLEMERTPAHFLDQWRAYAAAWPSVNAAAVAVTALALAVLLLWPRLGSRLPSPLVALLATTALVHAFDLPVATIGSRFGSVPSALPVPTLPEVPWSLVPALVPSAIAIALLGGIESLLSAVVADGMTGRRHRSNAELVAQGVANLVVPFFGGIPATGAIARTATNIKNGGKTPIAGMVHALTLLVILLFAGSWASLIPLPCLAGILLVVAYNMSEWRVFLNILKSPRSDILVLLVTFALTVVVDLVVAIQAGMVLAAFLFMRRMVEVTEVRALRELSEEEGLESSAQRGEGTGIPPEVEVFEIQGSFCFGAAQKFSEVLARTGQRPKAIILRMRHVLAVDATGLRALEEVLERCRGQSTHLLLCGVQAQPLSALSKSGLLDRLGAENLQPNLAAALEAYRQRADAGDPAA